MKMNFLTALPPNLCRRRPRERASAVLIVLVLMLIMATLVMSNSATLYQLKQELRLVEKRQLKKYERAGSARESATAPKPRTGSAGQQSALTNAAYRPYP